MIKFVIKDPEGEVILEKPREKFARLDVIKRWSSSREEFRDSFLVTVKSSEDDGIVGEILDLENKANLYVLIHNEDKQTVRGVKGARLGSYQSGYDRRYDEIVDDLEFYAEELIFEKLGDGDDNGEED